MSYDSFQTVAVVNALCADCPFGVIDQVEVVQKKLELSELAKRLLRLQDHAECANVL